MTSTTELLLARFKRLCLKRLTARVIYLHCPDYMQMSLFCVLYNSVRETTMFPDDLTSSPRNRLGSFLSRTKHTHSSRTSPQRSMCLQTHNSAEAQSAAEYQQHSLMPTSCATIDPTHLEEPSHTAPMFKVSALIVQSFPPKLKATVGACSQGKV